VCEVAYVETVASQSTAPRRTRAARPRCPHRAPPEVARAFPRPPHAPRNLEVHVVPRATPCTRQTERTRAALDRRSIRGIPSPVRRRAPLEHQRRVSLPRASVAVQPPQRPLAFPRATRVASCPSRAVVSSEQLLPRPPLPCATGWARRSRPHPSSVPKLTPCAP
jgi:hypothetical protein